MESTTKAVPIILKAAKSLTQYLEKDVARYGLNPAEFSALELLYHKGPQAIKGIGNKLLLAGSSMTYVIDKLTEKAYVTRSTCPTDRRQTTIELTDTGRAFVASIFTSHEQAIAQVFSVLSSDEYTQLTTLLKKVGYQSRQLLEEGQ